MGGQVAGWLAVYGVDPRARPKEAHQWVCKAASRVQSPPMLPASSLRLVKRHRGGTEVGWLPSWSVRLTAWLDGQLICLPAGCVTHTKTNLTNQDGFVAKGMKLGGLLAIGVQLLFPNAADGIWLV